MVNVKVTMRSTYPLQRRSNSFAGPVTLTDFVENDINQMYILYMWSLNTTIRKYKRREKGLSE